MSKIQMKPDDKEKEIDDLILNAINEPDVLAAVHYQQLKNEMKAAKRKLRIARRQAKRYRRRR